MFTSSVQKDAPSLTRYYNEHLSRDGYYADRAPGQWFGRGCQYLGIDTHAPVQKEDFSALGRGLRPDNHTKLTQRMKANRRASYDMTLSAPKSVSVMALVAGDERLIAAHERAVTVALEAAQRLASVRVRKGAAVDTQQSRITGNIVAARFLHRESRALDPQLHTHCVTFNVTHDPVENRFKALEARPIYDNSVKLTAIYREHLTQSLHALGYETYQDRKRCVQIQGVDARLLATYSKRSAQRDELVAQKQKELRRPLTNNEIARIIHQNRARKQNRLDAAALRKAQLERLSPHEHLRLAQVKQNALDVSAGLRTRQEAPQPKPQPYVPGPWIATVRLAMLATRSVNTDPYLFSPNRSFEDRVLWTVGHLQQVQRAKAIVRQMQRGQRGISR
jgi:conjugative relaxase-like TrwC/TraI family protein